MSIIERIKDTELRIQEQEANRTQIYEWWQQLLESVRNQREYKSTFKNFEKHMKILHSRITSLHEERKSLYLEFDAIIRDAMIYNGQSAEDDWLVREIQIGLLQDQSLYSDRQEPAINIDSEIDNKKSDDEMHQFIESIETENFVDDLSQAQQQ